MAEDDWSYRDACPDYEGGVYVVAGRDTMTNADVPVSFGLHWARGSWEVQKLPFIANSVAVCPASDGAAWIVGPYGHVVRWLGASFTESKIDASDDGPQNYGDVTKVRCTSGAVIAVGMARTVYRRGADRWVRIDTGTRTDDVDSDAGFTAIAGFSNSDIYAFGWDGEIWHYRNGVWRQIESPTNVAFHGAVAASDGTIYVCGQGGVIVKGREDSWDIVQAGDVSDDFRDITEYDGSIYVCSTKALYKLTDEPDLVNLSGAIAAAIKQTPSFYVLASDGQRLWSIGRRHVLTTTDCQTWASLSMPPG